MAGAPTRFDYRSLKRQYLAHPDWSLRHLAEVNGYNMNSISGLTRIAREQGWTDERDRLSGLAATKTLELLADREAQRAVTLMDLGDTALDLATEALLQLRTRITTLHETGKLDENDDPIMEPDLKLAPADVMGILKGAVEVASPKQSRPSTQTVSVTAPEGSQIALLAKFVDDVRDKGGPVVIEPD